MKRKLLALFLAMAMLLALTACGGGKDDAGTPEQGAVTATEDVDGTVDQPQETLEAGEENSETQNADGTTENNADTPAENLPADPAEEPEGGNLPADTTQKPESKPVEKPAEVPVSKPETPAQKPAEKPADESQSKPDSKVDLTAFYTSVTGGENWPAMMQVEGETLDTFYPGLSGIQTSQCGVYTAMISAAVGEIALVEVQNAADVQAVKDIFQARVDYQVGDDNNPGGAWYPASIEGWKSGSRIVSNGNYVMLVALSEGADSVVDSFNALFD